MGAMTSVSVLLVILCDSILAGLLYILATRKRAKTWRLRKEKGFSDSEMHFAMLQKVHKYHNLAMNIAVAIGVMILPSYCWVDLSMYWLVTMSLMNVIPVMFFVQAMILHTQAVKWVGEYRRAVEQGVEDMCAAGKKKARGNKSGHKGEGDTHIDVYKRLYGQNGMTVMT